MKRFVAMIAALAVCCSACTMSEDGQSPDPTEQTPTDNTKTEEPDTTNLEGIEFSGEFGQSVAAKFSGGFVPAEPAFRVLHHGEGEPVTPGQIVRVEYSVIDGPSGEVVRTTYGSQPTYIIADPAVTVDTVLRGIDGANPGTRIAFSEPANQAADSDSRIIVMDVLKVLPGRATGDAQKVPSGLPQITLADNGAPSIKIPDVDPPGEMLLAVARKGKGPAVEPGQTISAMYTGWKYRGGEEFDSTWGQLTPRDFEIGTGKVIKGWDAGLVGQTVGSQVLLVIPPNDAYGSMGNEQAGIGPEDALVFVVDILDAR